MVCLHQSRHCLKADSTAWGRTKYGPDNIKYHLVAPIEDAVVTRNQISISAAKCLPIYCGARLCSRRQNRKSATPLNPQRAPGRETPCTVSINLGSANWSMSRDVPAVNPLALAQPHCQPRSTAFVFALLRQEGIQLLRPPTLRKFWIFQLSSDSRPY